MRCPECRIPLVVVEREGIEIDWCLECRGMWFDEGELELLGEKAGRTVEVEDLGPADFRDVLSVSRKHLIPLLNHFDGSGVTVRHGAARAVPNA